MLLSLLFFKKKYDFVCDLTIIFYLCSLLERRDWSSRLFQLHSSRTSSSISTKWLKKCRCAFYDLSSLLPCSSFRWTFSSDLVPLCLIWILFLSGRLYTGKELGIFQVQELFQTLSQTPVTTHKLERHKSPLASQVAPLGFQHLLVQFQSLGQQTPLPSSASFCAAATGTQVLAVRCIHADSEGHHAVQLKILCMCFCFAVLVAFSGLEKIQNYAIVIFPEFFLFCLWTLTPVLKAVAQELQV